MVTYSFYTKQLSTGKLVIPKWCSKTSKTEMSKISGHSAINIWPQRQNTTKPPSIFEGAGFYTHGTTR